VERIGVTARQDPVNRRGVVADVRARAELTFAEAGFAVEKHVRKVDRRSRS
jgi:hypothetical protein